MAQQTQQTPMGIPGQVRSFVAKTVVLFDYDDKLTHITVEDGEVTAASNEPYRGVMNWAGVGPR